jgi:hypothetical protein
MGHTNNKKDRSSKREKIPPPKRGVKKDERNN